MASNKLSWAGRALPLFLLCVLICVSATFGSPLPQDGQPFGEYDLEYVRHPHGKVPSIKKCRELITAPPKDSSLFFTGMRSNSEIDIAKNYADNHGLTHVSKAYPKGFTDLGKYLDSDENKAQFQKNFMQVFAERSTGTAFLMIRDGQEPRDDSIWSKVELPTVRNSAQVPKVLRLSYESPPDDPNTSEVAIWTRPDDPELPPYAIGQCRVHFVQYKIPHHGRAYSLEATIFDGLGYEIGHQSRIDATEPINVESRLPGPLTITVAKPGFHYHPDKAAISFRYGHHSWISEEDLCSVGKYSHGDRDGDCSFDC